MNLKHVVAGVAVALAFSSAASAALVVDQSQPTSATTLANVTATSHPLQSFQTSAGSIAGGGFFFEALADLPSTYEIAVWDDLPNQAGADKLASGTVVVDGVSAEPNENRQWVDAFWTPIALLSGTTYYLTVDIVLGAGGTIGGVFRGDPYAPGELFLKDAGGVNYQTYSSDTAFRTYVDTGAVPEPETWALLILGFGGVGAMLRRDRRTWGTLIPTR